jgi:hypothetical protein
MTFTSDYCVQAILAGYRAQPTELLDSAVEKLTEHAKQVLYEEKSYCHGLTCRFIDSHKPGCGHAPLPNVQSNNPQAHAEAT